jgi:hypothetical protein
VKKRLILKITQRSITMEKKEKFFVGIVFLAFFMIGCATQLPPVTVSLYRDIEEEFAKFRFYISKDVKLTKVERNVSTDSRATVVRTDVLRNTINLKSSTAGRVQGVPTEEKLEIGFEQLRDGTIPTFSFIQKRGDGLYYFEQDSDEYIEYGGERYTVEYEGKEEPYLLYMNLDRYRERARSMSGLR